MFFFCRQLRETIYWIFSEPMIIYYIRNFKESMWPHGVLAPSLPPRSDEEKLRTRLKAKEKFLQIQPGTLSLYSISSMFSYNLKRDFGFYM
jgi:sorting nexin-25